MSKSFEQWMAKVNEAIEREIGLSADDLPDMPYADMWEDGVSPKRAARMAIREAGG